MNLSKIVWKDYSYFKESDKLNVINLSKQQTLDADAKEM